MLGTRMLSDAREGVHMMTTAANLNLEARAIRIGADILVYLWGGSRPHIGAVAAAQPRPSLANSRCISASCSVLTYPGHKEDIVVKRVSERLSATLNARVVVTAGMHWEHLASVDLKTIDKRVEEMISLLEEKLAMPESHL